MYTYIENLIDDNMINDQDDDKQTVVDSILIQRYYVPWIIWNFMEHNLFSANINVFIGDLAS